MNRKAIAGTVIVILVLVLGRIFVANGPGEPAQIRIGAILALTGSGAEFGNDEVVGAQMAIDRINASAGREKLSLIMVDSRSQAKDALAAHQQLMGSAPKPIAILTVMSGVSSALAPLAERDRVPLFCVAAAPALTRGNKYVFRSLPAADYQTRTLVQLSKSKLNYNSVAVLFINDEFGTSMESAFVAAANEKGVKVLRSEGVQPGASDFRPGFAKLLAAKPDAVYVAALGSDLGNAIRQLRELGYTAIVLTTLEIAYQQVLDLAGQGAERAFFVDTRFDPSSSDTATKLFVEEFRKRAKRVPSLDAVLAYDEVQLIYEAGLRKGFTSEGVRSGLLETRNYKSLNGSASMLANGDVAYELLLKVIKNGRPVPFEGE